MNIYIYINDDIFIYVCANPSYTGRGMNLIEYAGGSGSYFQARANEDLGSRTWKRTCKLGVPGHECAAGSLYKSVDEAVVSSYHCGPHPRGFNFEPHQFGFNLRTHIQTSVYVCV